MKQWQIYDAHCCSGGQSILVTHLTCGQKYWFSDYAEPMPTFDDLVNLAVTHVCLAKTGTP